MILATRIQFYIAALLCVKHRKSTKPTQAHMYFCEALQILGGVYGIKKGNGMSITEGFVTAQGSMAPFPEGAALFRPTVWGIN